MSNRATNIAGFVTFQMAVTAAGTPEKLGKKLISTGIAFVEGGDGVKDTITDSGNDFISAGFAAGDTIVITGSSSNDGTYTIFSVVAGTITLNAVNDLANESAGASVKVFAAVNVPDGVGVRIKATAGNTGNIHVADSSAKAVYNTTPIGSWVLDGNESIELQVTSTDLVWLDASTSGDKVEVIFEKIPLS